jgi:AraC-like DNA-binding protein
MLNISGQLTVALQLRFMSVKRYDLTYMWEIRNRLLDRAVIWRVEEGALRLEADDTQLNGKTGDVFVLKPGVRLTCRAETVTLRLLSLNVETAVPAGRGGGWPAALRLPLLVRGHPFDMDIEATMVALLADASAPDTGGKSLLLQAGVLRLIGLLASGRDAAIGMDFPPSIVDSRVREAVARMTGRPDAMPTVKELAEAARTSEAHLRKLFVRDMGMPPLHFLHRVKAELASHMLTAATLQVSEIAYVIGYADANYFARMFKKTVGLTPQEYRRRHRDWMQTDSSI